MHAKICCNQNYLVKFAPSLALVPVVDVEDGGGEEYEMFAKVEAVTGDDSVGVTSIGSSSSSEAAAAAVDVASALDRSPSSPFSSSMTTL